MQPETCEVVYLSAEMHPVLPDGVNWVQGPEVAGLPTWEWVGQGQPPVSLATVEQLLASLRCGSGSAGTASPQPAPGKADE